MKEVNIKNLSDEKVAVVIVSVEDLDLRRVQLENIRSTLMNSDYNTSYERRCCSEMIDILDKLIPRAEPVPVLEERAPYGKL